MASLGNAAAFGSGLYPHASRRLWREHLAGLALASALAWSAPATAAPSNVRIGGLTNLTFNTVADLTTDASLAEDVCVFSNSPTSGYRVTASGSGLGGAFTLAPPAGTSTLDYEVQWSSQAGGTSGSQLSAGVPLTGLISSATQQQCNNGPAASASLVVILRAAALSSATAGSYSGSLTLLIAPE